MILWEFSVYDSWKHSCLPNSFIICRKRKNTNLLPLFTIVHHHLSHHQPLFSTTQDAMNHYCLRILNHRNLPFADHHPPWSHSSTKKSRRPSDTSTSMALPFNSEPFSEATTVCSRFFCWEELICWWKQLSKRVENGSLHGLRMVGWCLSLSWFIDFVCKMSQKWFL